MYKTIDELFAYSNEVTCQETTDLLDAEYPGWTGSTSIDILPYLEKHRARGICVFALVSIFIAFTAAELTAFTSYASTALAGLTLAPEQQTNLDLALVTPTAATCRILRKTLLEQTSTSDGDILTECESILGLI